MRGRLVFLVLIAACGGQLASGCDTGKVILPGPGLPPPPPQANTTPATNDIFTFAVRDFFFGDTTRDGSLSTTAWRAFGYNLDGKVTTASSTDVCTLDANAPATNQIDGNDGIDNAWGETIVPQIQMSASVANFSQVLSDAIQKGDWTIQLQVVGLSDDPKQSSSGLRAQLFLSGSYGSGAPAFDTTTDWPVLSSTLTDGQTIVGGAKASFPNAYVNGGTFVSGPATDVVEIDITIQGVALPLLLHDAIISFVHADHDDAVDGTIAGVLDTGQLCDEITAIAGRVSTSFCTGPSNESVLDHYHQASDILSDGSNAPNVVCSGISAGFGFNAKLVANPTTVAQAPPPPPNPCAD